MASFNGLGMHMGNLAILSDAESRSISAENPTGEKGKGAMATPDPAKSPARKLGRGWKVAPYVVIEPGEVKVLADIAGAGAIAQIWMTPTGPWRSSIMRIYWDGSPEPSVECPVGDFFACGWNSYAQVSSLAVCVNPGSAFNCYWEMPFRKRCLITMTNTADTAMILFYQINYVLTEVATDAAYFHAQFRRVNPLPYKEVYTILDGVTGRGQYVGTYMAWGVHNSGWWGEGEIKFFIDGDAEFPDDLRHRHRGLFLRLVQFRRRQGKRRLSRVHDALRGTAASHSARRALRVAAEIRNVPLAYRGSNQVQARPAGDYPGARLDGRSAQGRGVPAAAGRHRVSGVLVPDTAVGKIPAAAVA